MLSFINMAFSLIKYFARITFFRKEFIVKEIVNLYSNW